MLHFQRWKVILVWGIVLVGFLLALPNLFSPSTLAGLPSWLPHKQVNLGLDLQGGAHLLYQLEEKEVVEDWLKTVRSDARDALRGAKPAIGYTDLAQNSATRSVSVKIRNAADFDKALERLFAQRMNATTIELSSSHVPMLSRPSEVAAFIGRAAAKIQ